jgi:transcriptional regulator with XRE-family HTH domain
MRTTGTSKAKSNINFSRHNVNSIDVLEEELFPFLGQSIWRLRRAKGLTQLELAEKMGLSRVAIATMEGGKQTIPFQNLLRLSRILGVPLSEMVPPGLKELVGGPGPTNEQFTSEEIRLLKERLDVAHKQR